MEDENTQVTIAPIHHACKNTGYRANGSRCDCEHGDGTQNGWLISSRIIEANGHTVFENGSRQPHKFPMGQLVYVQLSDFSPSGYSAKIEARMFITARYRDCDGTPLYAIAPKPIENWLVLNDSTPEEMGVITKGVNRQHNGLTEDDLTPLDVTDAMRDGSDILGWPEDK